MKTYIVGGAVRDALMGKFPKDTDYVIVGATEKDINSLIKKGFTQVGNSFPVFINPKNGFEYALARTERKVGVGYSGFECNTTNVKLEDDLLRRDLTINAIAYDETTKKYIDPYNGQDDIKNKILRHVSNAFSEDPVRVLRVARFSNNLSFDVHPSTIKLMKNIVKSGELSFIVHDRIIMELKKALNSGTIKIFLEVLNKVHALGVLFPGVKINKNLIDIIECACSENIDSYRLDYFWASLLSLSDEIIRVEIYDKYKLKKETRAFVEQTIKQSANYRKLKKIKSDRIIEIFDSFGSHNNTDQEFLYKLNTFLISTKCIDIDMDDHLFMLHDMYISIDIQPYIELYKLRNKSSPSGEWIKSKLRELRKGLISPIID